MTTKKHVAVIGAGQSGLCALKLMTEHKEQFTMVCFERAAEVGGQWLYTDKIGTDKYGLPVFSAMYYELTTNLPTSLMEIPGFPHPEGLSFVDRRYVFQYLQKFADAFELRKYVKFQTLVTKVRPLSDLAYTRWEVTYCDVRNLAEVKTEIFDAVLVYNGHYDTPYIPEVKGVELFQGTVIHSRDYRRNIHYKNQNVVLLGAKYSGIEIAVQLSACANKVFLANINDPIASKLPSNIFERPEIKQMTKSTVIFDDDREEMVDTLMYCTGFLYNLPFLDGVVTVENKHIKPLYKHIVHIEHPSLYFIGILNTIPYFPHNHEAARFSVRCLMGLVQVPSQEDMYEDQRKEEVYRRSLGMKPHHAHNMRDFIWDYNKELSRIGGFEPLPPVLRTIFELSGQRYLQDFLHFRKAKYRVTGSDSFVDDGFT